MTCPSSSLIASSAAGNTKIFLSISKTLKHTLLNLWQTTNEDTKRPLPLFCFHLFFLSRINNSSGEYFSEFEHLVFIVWNHLWKAMRTLINGLLLQSWTFEHLSAGCSLRHENSSNIHSWHGNATDLCMGSQSGPEINQLLPFFYLLANGWVLWFYYRSPFPGLELDQRPPVVRSGACQDCANLHSCLDSEEKVLLPNSED